MAVELSDGDKRMVYTADTGPGWSVSEFGAGADLVLSEASYQRDFHGDPHHLTAEEAGRAAAEAGARRLVITHLWPTLDPLVSVAEAEDGFGGEVTLAAPHLQVRV
jgi:ribonuclease BN (tRNA processing enzyme)